MFPSYTGDNAPHLRWSNADFCRYFAGTQAESAKPTYFVYLRFSQVCIWMMLAARCALSALSNHIFHVFGMGAKKEVIGIDTVANITTMKDIKIIGDGANMDFIREAVRLDCGTRNSERAIAINGVACPQPTFIWATSVYLFPETLLDRAATMMTTNKVIGFALNQASRLICFFGYLRLLTATAATKAIGDFKRWIVGRGCEKRQLWGMLLHSNSPFATLLTPPDGSNRRGGNLFPAAIIAQTVEWGNVTPTPEVTP